MFRIPQDRNFDIDIILKEVFMLKLASTLGVGPQFENIYGYDVIITKDTVEFAMEYCSTNKLLIFQEVLGVKVTKKADLTESRIKQFADRVQSDCLSAISILHSFQIAHKDIKPDNIGWSRKKKKFVFLDYGFAGFVKESIGQLSRTKFIGTFSYVCEEMKKLYFLKEEGFVDFYYNDAFGVLKSAKAYSNVEELSC